ncbi:MAG: gamma-glutamyltransferase family protein [Alphaproteobacteria bacterium]
MFTTRPEILGTFGVVSSTHWLASAAGMRMLELGGNAFDAAVAAGLTLQVVEPHLNGPGGDMPAILHIAATGESVVLCGQGPALAAATGGHYRGLGLGLVPGTGLLAAVVPGAFDAWMLMLRDHGTLPVEEVFGPALGYAARGAPMVARVGDAIAAVQPLFETEWPESAALWLKDGRPPAPGALHANPTLAATWERLLAEGRAAGPDRAERIEAMRRAWAEGFIAEAVDRHCRNEFMDVTGRRHAGLLTGQDMARWRARYEAPARLDFRGMTVLKGGPWSQGPVQLQALSLLDGFPIEAMDPLGADFVHTVTECTKLAFADREAFYGDPDFVPVPMEALLSEAYAARRRALVGDEASLELRPGRIEGFGAEIDYARHSGDDPSAKSDLAGIGEPTAGRRAAADPAEPRPGPLGQVAGDTCHVDIIDRHGNMVSAMPSGGWLQSSPAIPGLGFALGTRAQMFWLEPGLPASLAPGKRPRSTLSPSMALKDGRPWLAYGTPGGDQQDQWQLNFLLRHALHGMNLQQAIDAPSFHNEHFPSSFYPRRATPGRLVLEGRFPPETIRELRRRGHLVEVGGDWSEGRMCAASQQDGLLKAAANPRGMQGYAAGR